MNERARRAVYFLLSWLSTPTSKIGLTVMLAALAGKHIAPHYIDAITTALALVAGALLVAYPEKPRDPP